MGEINLHTIEKTKLFISEILDSQLPSGLVFHSKQHTFDVLKNVELIGEYSNLKEKEMNLLRLCALFHDVGYIKMYKGHELESVAIAKEFLLEQGISEPEINRVTTAILATKVPQNPKDNLSKILCDADLMHLTYDNYFEQIELMRQEWKSMNIASLNPKDFHINSINFFKSHHYHSEYGKNVLKQKKEKTLKLIKAKLTE